jgi:2-dehydro-3-deoxyphosphogluconate aldolase/(4S)-4-hydroxy-2-oxoglutarate aldolase
VKDFVEKLQQERIVVVIRGAQVHTLEQTLQALYEGGLRIFEVTVEATHAMTALASLRGQLPADALIGVGTVLDAETADAAIAAGAQFIVSPILQEEVYRASQAQQVPCILAGMTPTEIYRAYRLGCPAVKVFPASVVGAAMLRELGGPLGQIPLYPTGGMTLNNARLFLEAGAIALGVGSSLVHQDWISQGNWQALRTEAAKWVQCCTPFGRARAV